MEIAIVGTKSLRVKSKNASFIINPEKKFDEDVLVFTEKPNDYSIFGDKLVIDGPGDFETHGTSIKGERNSDGISFEFLDEGQKLIVVSAPSVAKDKEVDEGTAVVSFVTQENKDGVSQIASNMVAVIGDDSVLPEDRASVKKIDKVNLKKTEEYKGFLVHLSK